MILKANKELKQKDFKNEKELQNFFENNIETILGYKFIDTEFVVGDFRIDSLAFDEESKSFRIIEYKNVKNHSLVDQGYTYLKLMLERKADFVLQYNIKTKSSLTTQDIDWSQSRIIFVAPIYTAYQLNATDFKNIPVDLVKLTRYEDDITEIDFIKKTSNVKVQDIQMESIQNDVNKEIIVYTEEDHLSKVSDNIKRVYEELKNRILELDDIDVEAKKLYIAFKGIRNIADIEFHKNKLKIYINMKKDSLNDPLKLTKDISGIGHWGNGDYCIIIDKKDDIDNVIPLIKQSLKVNKK
jgi:predicted transport protein